MHSVTLFSDAFVATPIINILYRTEWKTLIIKTAWIWKHDRIKIILFMNILDGWITRVPRQFYDLDVTNKDKPDVMDENILKWSWSKNCLTFWLEIELSDKHVHFIFIALKNMISTSWMHLYQIDFIIAQGVLECLNFSIVVEHIIPFTSF